MESTFFSFEMKEKCKVSCVKTIACLIVFKEGTSTLSFYMFDYGAECSAESGAQQYSIKLRNAVRPTEEDIEGASFEFWFLVDAEFLLWRQDVEQILTYHNIFGYISYEVTFY